MTNKINAWDWDLRVRERNLKAGVITEKDVEKFLGTVPDVEAQAESFATPQPALDPPDEPEEIADEPSDDSADEA
jgi:hypothetical protein